MLSDADIALDPKLTAFRTAIAAAMDSTFEMASMCPMARPFSAIELLILMTAVNWNEAISRYTRASCHARSQPTKETLSHFTQLTDGGFQ